MKKKSLGRGLSSLISTKQYTNTTTKIPVSEISLNPYQVRDHFSPKGIEVLSRSLKKHGVIQPLVVSQRNGNYILVAGERRLRAAKKAGIKEVPVVILDVTDRDLLALALVENVQREDLNPLEEALAFNELREKFSLSLDEISSEVGKSPATISNKMRLLQLSQEIKKGLIEKKITEGHARALLGLEKKKARLELYRKIVAENLSVRDVERIVRRNKKAKKTPAEKEVRRLEEWENRIHKRLSLPVRLTSSKRGGKLTIKFKKEEDLEKILTLLGVK